MPIRTIGDQDYFRERPAARLLLVLCLGWLALFRLVQMIDAQFGTGYLASYLWLSVAGGTLPLLLPHRTALRVDPDGLTEIGHLRPDVHHSWSVIRGVVLTGHGLRINSAHGDIRVDSNVPRWRTLFALVQEHLRDDGPSEPEDVSPQQIEAWLGIAPGETLVCSTGREFARYGCALSILSWSAMIVIEVWSALPLLVGALAAIAVWAACTALGTTIRANGLGYSVRRGFGPARHFGWDQVLGKAVSAGSAWRFYLRRKDQDDDLCVTVTTTTGDFRFHLSDRRAAPLRDCLHELLAAREAGQRLPAGSAVTPASLSRPRLTGAEAAERGLSVVRGDD